MKDDSEVTLITSFISYLHAINGSIFDKITVDFMKSFFNPDLLFVA